MITSTGGHEKRAICKFIRDYPAMTLGEWLVVADLHLGITREVYEAGVSLPSQVRSFVQHLHELKRKTKTKRLILLGDVKHKVPGTNWQEEQEIPDFLNRLDFEQIILIKGNHDAEIEKMIPRELKTKVKIKKDFVIGECYFTHGNRKLPNLTSPKGRAIRTIIIGHNQPAVLFRDQMEARYVEPCWVRGMITCAKHKQFVKKRAISKKKQNQKQSIELIIMPAFNELRGHTLVNRDRMIGPIAKMLTAKSAHVFLLDGTDIGTIEDLKKDE